MSGRDRTGALTRRSFLRTGVAVAAVAGTAPWWLRNDGSSAQLSSATADSVRNLLANPRAITDTVGWEPAPGSTHALSWIAGDGVAPGTTSVQLDYGPVDPAQGAAAVVGRLQSIPVTADQLVWARAAAKTVAGAPGTQLELLVIHQRDDGAPVAQNRVSLEGGGPADGWIELAGFDMVPEGATRCHLAVRAVGNPQPGSSLRVTNAMLALEPGEYLPYVDGPAPLPRQVAPVRRGFLRGFNDNSVGQELLSPEKDAALHKEIGSTVLRVTIDLRNAGFQTGRGAPTRWEDPYPARFDALYRACRDAGVKLLPIALGAPEWMLAGRQQLLDELGPDPMVPPPPHLYDEWGKLCASLVDRWPGVAGIEVWNEPNLGTYFWQPRADPGAYAALLRATAAAVRVRHPNVPVLNGGLAGLLHDGPRGVDLAMAGFLEGMYTAGAKGSFDGLSLHTYLVGANPDAALGRNLRNARRIMGDQGDRRPLWITETGSSTVGAGWGITVSERHQAALNRIVYGLLKRQPDVQAVCLHTLVAPDRFGGENYEAGFGVAARNGRHKPAFSALRAEWRNEPVPRKRKRRRKRKARRRPRRRARATPRRSAD